MLENISDIYIYKSFIYMKSLGIVAHTSNPSPWEIMIEELPWVLGWPGLQNISSSELHGETLIQNETK